MQGLLCSIVLACWKICAPGSGTSQLKFTWFKQSHNNEANQTQGCSGPQIGWLYGDISNILPERERESRCCWADRRSAFLVKAPLLLYFFQFRIGPTMGRTYWATTKPNDWQSQILESKTPLDQISCSFIQEQGTNRGRPNTLGWHKKYSWDPKTIELSVVKSPCLHPVFGPAFTSCPLFQWYLQSNEILLNLTKCTMFQSYCMKLSLPPKLMEKTNLGLSYFAL